MSELKLVILRWATCFAALALYGAMRGGGIDWKINMAASIIGAAATLAAIAILDLKRGGKSKCN